MIKKRILIKLSGEALLGKSKFGIDVSVLSFISNEIKNIFKKNYQICIVVGGGNIFRGIKGESQGIDRSTSDYIGMLATIMNALSLQSSLEQISVPTRVQSAISMSQIAEPYIRRKAIRHLEKKRVVIFAAGTGNPFFSTDTAASLRASELNCSTIVKATKVDGIYNIDPVKNLNAKIYKKIKYHEVISKDLRVMDTTSISLAKESNIPILITNIFKKNSILNALKGKGVYSIIN
ncbi:MAG: UMP kinase [Rickettsiales bacterium]|nr:UMP kinase [Rickettsiales bacterium]|tara:strand:- start:3314 stop:4018 length:705 start_codon:yes stop_codon:yes gene_type:complete